MKFNYSIGTSNFPSSAAAYRYYKSQDSDFTLPELNKLIDEKSISIGRPKAKNALEVVRLCEKEERYYIDQYID